MSEWSLELFNDRRKESGRLRQAASAIRLQHDFGRALHVKYTAKEDAGPFKNGAIANLRDYFSQDGQTPSWRMLSLRQEFPSQWQRFLHPTDPAKGNIFELALTAELFRTLDAAKMLKINTVWLLARCTDPNGYEVTMTPPLPAPPPPGANELTLVRSTQLGGLHFAQRDTSADAVVFDSAAPPVTWRLAMTRPGGGNLQEDAVTKEMEVEDLVLVLGYEWE